jgi:hypothetical protein
MAGESSQRIARMSSCGEGTSVPRNVGAENPSKFGDVVRVLWPQKPALRLSQLADCTERHANLLIKGERKPNARVALAILGEIIS